MRILHFADLHLDASFTGAGMPSAMASRRREDLRGALKRIMDLALKLEVDAVTVGGDLYEQERYTRDTGNFLREQFERLRPVPVLIAPGNHDPWVPDSLYRQVPWPDNVVIFSEPALRPVRLIDVTFWGAAHCSPAFRESVVSGVRVPSGGVHVLLLHASDTAGVPEGKPVVCPLTRTDVESCGFDLALLGHYHGARLSPAESPVVCYPGSPEPLGFDELGPRRVLLVNLHENEKGVTAIEVEHRTYAVLSVDVSPATNRESIKEMAVMLAREKDLREACVRLHLTGTLHPDVELDVQGLVADLKETFAFLSVRDETKPGYDLEALKRDATVKGVFVRKMTALMEKGPPDQKEVAMDALLLGLQALDKRDLKPR